MKTIGIAGYGKVGKAMADFFKTHYQVKVYDPLYKDSKLKTETLQFVKSLKDLDDCDLLTICVPTPMLDSGDCDISEVEKVVRATKCPLILIKSTVTPGTTKHLTYETCKNIVFSPSFVGEGKYWSPFEFYTDVKESPYFIFGGHKFLTALVIDLLVPIVGPNKKYYTTDSTTAELVKYMVNTYLAAKVTLCNEFYDICSKMDVSYWEARELWLLDPRIEESHTAVFADDRGFGGKCLPKDVNGLVAICKKMDYQPKFIESILKRNEDFTTYTDELIPAEKSKGNSSSTLPKGTKIKII